MADAKTNPDATPDRDPKKKVGNNQGSIKGPQVDENHNPERWDTKRGSDPVQRSTSGHRG